MEKQTSHVKSIARAMEILDCLAEARTALSLQEISLRTGWAKSTVHGMLSTLREYSVIEQSASTGEYRLGIRLFELGNVVSKGWNIIPLAKPYLQKISTRTRECACIGMLDKDAVLYLDHVDTGTPLRVVTDVGSRMPLHCTALGKAMLAYMPKGRMRHTLLRAGIPVYTPHTLSSIGELERECASVRETGSAIENGEMRVGMRCVASPIFDHTGEAKYAVGVAGMFRAITDETFQLAKQSVLEAAYSLSGELGYRGDAWKRPMLTLSFDSVHA